MNNVKKKLADWIAVDWGTSNLRVWLMNSDGVAFSKASSKKGMGKLSQDEFEPALLELIEPYISDFRVVPVVCAGMVGARQGWMEAPYSTAPCPPPGWDGAIKVSGTDRRLDVRILPGVMQLHPANVMRGEETQILGFLYDKKDFDGVVCLPGTHTKWVNISKREILNFATSMTGELFELLTNQSVLRHGMDTRKWDEQEFVGAVDETITHPTKFNLALFSLRAELLLNEMTCERARSRLSGLLIGMELASTEHFWRDQNVVFIGEPELCARYRRALDRLGAASKFIDGSELILAGFIAARPNIADVLL